MSAVYTLAGVDLDRWTVSGGTTYRAPVSVQQTLVEVPGRHGSIPIYDLPVFSDRSFTFELAPLGTGDDGAFEALNNDLVALLSQPGLVLQRTVAGVTHEAPVRLESATPGSAFRWGSFSRWTVVVGLVGVFWRDVSPTSTGLLSPGSHSLTDLVGSAPIADAVVRFSGPTAHVWVTDSASGTGIQWTGTVNADQYVYLHPDTMTARRSGSASAWGSGGTDVSSGLDYPVRGRLQLWPISGETSPGVLRRQVQVTTTGAPGMIRARRSWL